jgi:quercetin dioxygenase-like cupin family protein
MGAMENQAPAGPHAAKAPVTPSTPVTREILLDEAVSPVKATARIQIRRIRIAPGYPAGPHTHNGPVFGSIETGSAVFQVAGRAPSVLRPGDVFHEPEGAVIEKFDATEEGVTFLGYFPVADGEDPEIKPA